MRKLLLIAAAALGGLAAGPALADATGTVNVSGTVTAKCSTTGTNPVNLDVGELADSNGLVVTSFAQNTHANFTFVCTSAKPTVTVTATTLTGPTPPVGGGYTNLVQYKATVTAYLTGGTANATHPFVNTDGSNPANSNTTQLTAQLYNHQDNVQVDISNPTSNGSLLMAGSYTGQVVVTLAPTS